MGKILNKLEKENNYMETFLRDYVEMIADTNEIELNETQMQSIVNNLRQEDEIWDVLDSYVTEEIARAVKEVK